MRALPNLVWTQTMGREVVWQTSCPHAPSWQSDCRQNSVQKKNKKKRLQAMAVVQALPLQKVCVGRPFTFPHPIRIRFLFSQVAVEFSKLTCSQLIKSEGVVGGHVELDSVAERVLLLSPLVDDMVSDLPAPISPPHLSNLVCYTSIASISICTSFSRQGLALGKQLLEFMDAVDTCEFAPRHGNSTGAPPTARQYRDLTDSALSKLQKSTT